MSEHPWRPVQCRVWTDERIEALDPIAKLLWIYLLTSPQTNRLGIYCIDLVRASRELGVNSRKLRTSFSQILTAKLAFFDEERSVLLIPKWMKVNRPDNWKHAKGIIKDASAVPATTPLWSLWAQELRASGMNPDWIGILLACAPRETVSHTVSDTVPDTLSTPSACPDRDRDRDRDTHTEARACVPDPVDAGSCPEPEDLRWRIWRGFQVDYQERFQKLPASPNGLQSTLEDIVRQLRGAGGGRPVSDDAVMAGLPPLFDVFFGMDDPFVASRAHGIGIFKDRLPQIIDTCREQFGQQRARRAAP